MRYENIRDFKMYKNPENGLIFTIHSSIDDDDDDNIKIQCDISVQNQFACQGVLLMSLKLDHPLISHKPLTPIAVDSYGHDSWRLIIKALNEKYPEWVCGKKAIVLTKNVVKVIVESTLPEFDEVENNEYLEEVDIWLNLVKTLYPETRLVLSRIS